jgi:hypothetical protein
MGCVRSAVHSPQVDEKSGSDDEQGGSDGE